MVERDVTITPESFRQLLIKRIEQSNLEYDETVEQGIETREVRKVLYKDDQVQKIMDEVMESLVEASVGKLQVTEFQNPMFDIYTQKKRPLGLTIKWVSFL